MVEGRDFDLVTMGRSEGRGCYCYINNLLRTFLDGVMDDYPYVVIDNEAGMEHLSRRTCQRMDVLLVVSDATKVGPGYGRAGSWHWPGRCRSISGQSVLVDQPRRRGAAARLEGGGPTGLFQGPFPAATTLPWRSWP